MSDTLGHMQTRRPNGGLAIGVRTAAVWALAVLTWLPSVRAGVQSADDAATLLAAISAEDSTPESRQASATRLLGLTLDAPTLAALESVLAVPEGGGQSRGRRAVLLAIADASSPPAALYEEVLAGARSAADPHRAEAVAALGAFRTRDAAGSLVQIAAESEEGSVRAGAFRALVALSGRSDLGVDIDRWRAWQSASVPLSDRQWMQQLVEAHARRAAEAEARTRVGESRLADAYRQIHLLTPADQRSQLLAAMLRSGASGLQLLGFDLAHREIGESQVLQPVVAEATIELLSSGNPEIRGQAAILLDRLAPASGPEPLFAALARETDLRAADAMLRAAARWPSPLARGPVLRWLEGPASIRPRAAGAAWTLLRADLLVEMDDRAAVLRGVRSIATESLNGAVCRLLVTLGDESDLERLRGLLVAPEPAVRTMAADALALRADQVESLLRHATEDPVLFEPTAKAIHAHMRDARGYDALVRLVAPSPRVRAQALSQQASVLPTSELVRLAKLQEPGEAVHLLGPLTSPQRLEDATQASELGEGLLLLAETQAALGSPAEGLNALSLLPAGTDSGPEGGRVARLRVVFLLWLNRLEEAGAVEAGADAWLDGLERSVREAHAGAIVAALLDRFDGELTEAQLSRLDGVRRALASANGGGGESGG